MAIVNTERYWTYRVQAERGSATVRGRVKAPDGASALYGTERRCHRAAKAAQTRIHEHGVPKLLSSSALAPRERLGGVDDGIEVVEERSRSRRERALPGRMASLDPRMIRVLMSRASFNPRVRGLLFY